MTKKYKRIVAMILATLMVATSVPAEHLLSVKAATVSSQEIETYISGKRRFTDADYEQLKEYYDICIANNYDIPSMERMENALDILAMGVEFYDDFGNFGEYVSATDEAGYLKEPENAGDYLPTSKNTTNYEIVWGGLHAQRIEGKEGTFPKPYNLTSGLDMYAFHFSNWYYEGAEDENTYTNQEAWKKGWAFDVTRNPNYEDAWDRFNFLTLKQEVLGTTEGINILGGTVQALNDPLIIYNYVDPYNWSAVRLRNGIRKIECVDNTIIGDPVYNKYCSVDLVSRSTIGDALPGYCDSGARTDFQMAWNASKGCYTMTLSLADDPSKTYSFDLNKSEHPLKKLDNLYLTAYSGTSEPNLGLIYRELYVASNIAPFLDEQILQTVPEVKDVTRLMLKELETYDASLRAYGDEVYAQLTNIGRLSDAIAKAKELQKEYEKQFTLQGVTLTAEDGHPLEYADYFKDSASVQVVANPKKDTGNTSEKVLSLKNGKMLHLVDSVNSNIKIVSGRFIGSVILVFAYQDENNYQGIRLGYDVAGGYASYGNYGKVNGKGLNGYNSEPLFPDGVTGASSWMDFTLWIDETEIIVTYGVLGTDGKMHYNTENPMNATIQLAGDSTFALVGNAASAYLDDFTVCYGSTNEYYAVSEFWETNEQILRMFPFSKHISAATPNLYDELVAGYNALSIYEKNIMGPVYQQKVAEIQKAYEDAQGTTQTNRDQEWVDAAKDDYKALGTPFAKAYRAFASGKDNSYLSQWEWGHIAWGKASVVSDALRIRGNGTLLLKEDFVPDKAVLKKASYKLRGVGSVQAANNDPKQVVYLYYVDEDNRSYLAFTENRWWLYTYTKGTEKRSVTNYEDDTRIDISTTLSVTWENKNGQIIVQVADTVGGTFEYKMNYSAVAKNRLAVACYSANQNSAGRGGISNHQVEVYDVEAYFTRGDWDDDVTQEELRVNYTGNTYQAPGDIAVIRGENLGKLVQNVKIIRVADKATDTVGFIDRTSYDYDGVHDGEFTMKTKSPNVNWDKAETLEIIHKSTDSVQFMIPDDIGHGIYAVQLSGIVKRELKTKVVYLNAPSIDYTLGSDGQTVAPGMELDIVGENLAPNQNANADAKAAYKRVKDRDLEDVKVKLISKADPTRIYDLTIEEITSDYHIVVKIPEEIEATETATEWQLSVYNGYGDGTAWSIPTIVKVQKAFSEIQAEKYPMYVNIRDKGATGEQGQNATPILQAAINELYETYGGGTIYLPEGVYRLEYTIYLPENIRLVGDGKALTNILTTYFDWNYGELFEQTGFVVSDNCEISGMGFYLKRCQSFIDTKNGKIVSNFVLQDVKFYSNVAGWSNNSPGSGKPLIDRSDLIKYIETNGEADGYLCGIYQNLKMTDVLSDYNNNKIAMFSAYNSQNNYGRFCDIVDNDASDTWNRAIFSNAIWRDSEISGTTATQGKNVYMYNVKFGPATGYNREIWVADLSGWTTSNLQLLPGDDGTLENSVYVKRSDVGEYSIANDAWMALCVGQIYVRSGNGEGQTRTIVGTDTEKNAFIIDRPFDVPINRNSTIMIRAPREDIYFVDCEFYEGKCAGGFFGGCADVVYDGNYYNYASDVYFEAIFNDVNWYCSNINAVWENTPYGLGASFDMTKTSSYEWIEDATNLDNGQLAMLIRNCDVVNMPMSSSSYGGNQYDFIIDNNRFDKMEYIIQFSKSGIPDGLTFYRNTGNSLVAYAKNSKLTGNNEVGYAKAHILDGTLKEVEVKLYGDANLDGVVNLDDVSYVQYAVAGKVSLTMSAFEAADVDGDGAVTVMDASLIQYYVLGLLDQFPADPTPPGTKPDEPEEPDEPDGPTNPDVGDDNEDLDVDDNVGSDDDYTPGYH